MPERIILDTNTFIDGEAGDFSYPVRIIEQCLSGKITPLKSHPIERENRLILNRLSVDEEYKEWLEDYFDQCEMIHTTTRTSDIPDDHEDEKFLECAIDGNADVIVTNDYHLLSLDPYRETIRIMKPSEYWNRWEMNDETGTQWNDFAQSIGIG